MQLDWHEALQLFSKYAFNKNEPGPDYLQLTNQFIFYANGLPLALQIIGSDLRRRNIRQWESELEKYKNIPCKVVIYNYMFCWILFRAKFDYNYIQSVVPCIYCGISL